jgi:hypothetical protein
MRPCPGEALIANTDGTLRVSQDVDLWFEDLGDPRLAEALRQINAAYVPPIALNPPMIAGPGTEPFNVVVRMDGLGVTFLGVTSS